MQQDNPFIKFSFQNSPNEAVEFILNKISEKGYEKDAFRQLLQYNLYNTLEHFAQCICDDYEPKLNPEEWYDKKIVESELKKDTWGYISGIIKVAGISARYYEYLTCSYLTYYARPEYRNFIPHYKDYAGYVLEEVWLTTSSFATRFPDLTIDDRKITETFEGKLKYPIVRVQTNYGVVVTEEKYKNPRILQGQTESVGNRGRKKVNKEKNRKQGSGLNINSSTTFYIYSKYNNFKKPYNIRVFANGLVQVIGVVRNDKLDFYDVTQELHKLLFSLGLTKYKYNPNLIELESRNINSNILQPFKVKKSTYSKDAKRMLVNKKDVLYMFNLDNIRNQISEDKKNIQTIKFKSEKSDNNLTIQFANYYKQNNNFPKIKSINLKLLRYKINYTGTFAKEDIISIHKWLNRICILYFKQFMDIDKDKLEPQSNNYYNIKNVKKFAGFVHEQFMVPEVISSSD
jgi:hypothetical protein